MRKNQWDTCGDTRSRLLDVFVWAPVLFPDECQFSNQVDSDWHLNRRREFSSGMTPLSPRARVSLSQCCASLLQRHCCQTRIYVDTGLDTNAWIPPPARNLPCNLVTRRHLKNALFRVSPPVNRFLLTLAPALTAPLTKPHQTLRTSLRTALLRTRQAPISISG